MLARSPSATPRSPCDGLAQPLEMQVPALVEEGVDSARPTAPPRLRVRLKRPEAFLIGCGGKVPRARLLIGTIHTIMPEAAQHLGDEQLVEIPVLGDVRSELGAERESDESEREHQTGVEAS